MKRFIGKYRRQLIMGPLFKILEVFFDLAVPMLMSSIIDVGISHNDRPYIIRHIVIIVALGIIGFLCTTIAQYFAAKASVGIVGEMKNQLFAHIQSLSGREMDLFSYSSLNSRLINDTNQVQNGINLAMRLLVRSPFIVFGAFFMAYRISPQLSLIFLASIILLLIIVSTITHVTIPLYGKVQKQLDNVLAKVRDNLTGTRILRAFNRQDQEIAEMQKETAWQLVLQKKVTAIANLLNPLTYSLINVAIILLIHHGAVHINNGLLTQGAIIALYNYLSQILVELVKLVNLIIVITRAFASYKRINEVFQAENSLPLTDEPVTVGTQNPQIEFRNVSFQYPDASADTLENLSFRIEPQQTVGIIGATGSGKSTLADLLMRNYDVTSGQILLNGVDIRNYPLDQLHDLITLVYQKTSLFSGTVRSNMLMARPQASDQQIIQALKDAQIYAGIDGDLDRKVNQGGRNFSGGQRQRLCLAQSFLKDSDIMILDDSTSALDFHTESLIKQQLLKSRKTLLIISQRISNMINADQILVLDNGRLAGCGRHEELLKNCAVYQQIYASQNRKEER